MGYPGYRLVIHLNSPTQIRKTEKQAIPSKEADIVGPTHSECRALAVQCKAVGTKGMGNINLLLKYIFFLKIMLFFIYVKKPLMIRLTKYLSKGKNGKKYIYINIDQGRPTYPPPLPPPQKKKKTLPYYLTKMQVFL